MPTPHRAADDVVKGLVRGANNTGHGVVSGVKGAVTSITDALDKPFAAVTKKKGPHHIIDRVLNGAIDATQNLVEVGVVGSAEKLGEGIMSGLDFPTQEYGFPPSDFKALEIKAPFK